MTIELKNLTEEMQRNRDRHHGNLCDCCGCVADMLAALDLDIQIKSGKPDLGKTQASAVVLAHRAYMHDGKQMKNLISDVIVFDKMENGSDILGIEVEVTEVRTTDDISDDDAKDAVKDILKLLKSDDQRPN